MNDLMKRIIEHSETHDYNMMNKCPMVVSKQEFREFILDDSTPIWLSPEDKSRILNVDSGLAGEVMGIPIYIFQ